MAPSRPGSLLSAVYRDTLYLPKVNRGRLAFDSILTSQPRPWPGLTFSPYDIFNLPFIRPHSLTTKPIHNTFTMASPTAVRDFGGFGGRGRSQTAGPPQIHLQDVESQRGRRHSSQMATAAQPNGGTDPHFSPSRLSVDSTLRRRPTRSNTVRTYHSPSRPNWQEPGAEPGIDTGKEAESHYEGLQQDCDITVVDFSPEKMTSLELDNNTLEDFLQKPKEDWVECRWINVNGLSWDVIRLLGNYKGLHRLAIEDLMNPIGRTKADWYSDQAYCKCLSIPEIPHNFFLRGDCIVIL